MLLLSFALVALTTALLSSAQSSSSSSTSSAPIATHSVSVGADGFQYTPNQIQANVGDVIEYRFYPQNHSVARAEYKQPCIPYEDTGPNKQGFWSGFHPVAVVLSDPPIFQVTVNDTEPIFFYCSAPGACIGNGMIGVINPNGTEAFQIQFEYAQNATTMFSPGEYFPAEVASSTTSSTTSSPTSSTSPSSTSATAAPSSGSKLSTGAIVGIAIGSSAVALLIAALFYLCGKNRTMGEVLRHTHSTHASYQPGPLGSPGMSEANYPNKYPNMNIDPTNGRYSAQGGGFDRSAAETESYRSRSPPIDETGMMIPPMGNLTGSPRSRDFNREVMARTVMPDSTGFSSPAMGEGTYHETAATEVPAVLRLHRAYSTGLGPHELPVPSRQPNTDQPLDYRPFSYTGSESEYTKK